VSKPSYNELGRLADMLTEPMIFDMQHALGHIQAVRHSDEHHRNYYVTGNAKDTARWELLERNGLAVRGAAKGWIPGAVFRVTDTGKRVLQLVEGS
jgi:hypothetical protein